jgi:hypothetical protein
VDKNLRLGILVIVGGVGVYLVYKGGYFKKWFPTLFTSNPADAASDAAAAKAKADLAASDAAAAKAKADLAAAQAAANPTNTAAQAAAVKAASDAAAAKAIANTAALKATADAAAAAAAAAANPTCPAGQWNYNGTCVPTGTGPTDTVTKVATAAGKAGMGPLLNMDQWCYFYKQIVGSDDCPDPGAIPDSVYAGAWGQAADRTTPIDAGTWWALSKWANPGLAGAGMAGVGWET